MLSRPLLRTGPTALTLLLAGCAPLSDSAPDSVDSAATLTELDPTLAASLALGQPVVALLRLDDGPIAVEIAGLRGPQDRPGDRPALIATRAAAWKSQSERLLRELPPGVTVERVYTHIPVVALRLSHTEAALELLQRPDVLSLDPNVSHTTDISQSLSLIGQPTAQAAGFLGAGTAVAVLDTGADWTVSDLGSCTAVGTPSTCRVAYAADIATNDGQRDDSSSPHGTNVSAIVAKVAPGADILALDVFTGGAASSTDIIAAIDWVIANQATYNIAALNMSLGSGLYSAECSTAFSSAIANARAAGVVVVAATGNNGSINAIASPACDAGALSVGAVYDASYGGLMFSACFESSSAADQVACFSNTTSFVDILAPGAFITAGGQTMAGTSQAAPHVAGAVAVLRATDASATVDQLEDRLTANGVLITDSRTGLSFPRLALDASVTDCITALTPSSFSADAAGDSDSISLSADSSCAWTVSSDAAWLSAASSSGTGSSSITWTAAANTGAARSGNLSLSGRTVPISQAANAGPTGTVSIASGAAGTRSTAVTLSLSATDTDGLGTMCISNSSTCTAWEAYNTSKSWTLSSSGSATKTVYVSFRDSYGNTGSTTTDTIVYDTTVPTNGSTTASGSDSAAAVSWTGFVDAGSGISSYKVVYGTTAPAASCTNGTVGYTGSSTSATLSGLSNGSTYTIRVCAIDNAGNTSTGATTTVRPAPEYNAPTGSISLAGGATWTKSRSVPATIAATDDTGVATMCLSTSTTCSTFVAYNTSATVTLGSTAGTQTVYATFKDAYGTTATAVTDTIIYDATAPTNGTVTASASSGQVSLSWTGFADATSGIATYTLVQGTTTAPTSCSTGTVVYSGSASSATVTGLSNGTTYGFRVCAVDNAGNTSTGASVTTRPAPEYNAPTGTITLAGGATWTNTRGVSATLSATDDTSVSSMCLSTTTTCSTFVAYNTTGSATLASTAGSQTVYATFKDAYGNTSTAVTDTIIYDATAPTNGTVTASPSAAQVALTWTGFADAGSGVYSYKVVQGTTTAPTSCSTGTVVYTGSATNTTITGLTNGTTYGFRVCAVDNAGNTSTGASTTSRPAPEYNAPTGTITLASGATWTKSRSVTATLAATDDTAVGTMCLSTTATCTTFIAYNTTGTASLGTTAGSQTVYATFKDSYGNTSTAVTDTISYDGTAPTNGTVTATPGAGQLGLSWTASTDATSGLSGYKVVYGTSSPASTCSTGTVAYTGTSTSTTITELSTGAKIYYRVCAQDVAGNTATGATGSATPL